MVLIKIIKQIIIFKYRYILYCHNRHTFYCNGLLKLYHIIFVNKKFKYFIILIYLFDSTIAFCIYCPLFFSVIGYAKRAIVLILQNIVTIFIQKLVHT